MPTLKGTEASLSCVQCFSYLISSLINVSVSHITWLVDTSGQASCTTHGVITPMSQTPSGATCGCCRDVDSVPCAALYCPVAVSVTTSLYILTQDL